MNISFGQKIPIARAQIYNKEQKSFIPVTCYEYDCEDEQDIKTVENQPDIWEFKDSIVLNMQRKYSYSKEKKTSPIGIFTIEKKDGEILGMCATRSSEKDTTVKFIESHPKSEHKYVGQVLLASIGKITVLGDKKKEQFKVEFPTVNAYDFYTKKCGFIESEDTDLAMNRLNTHLFVKRTERKTQSPIINLKG